MFITCDVSISSVAFFDVLPIEQRNSILWFFFIEPFEFLFMQFVFFVFVERAFEQKAKSRS